VEVKEGEFSGQPLATVNTEPSFGNLFSIEGAETIM
jgi:hypothetical protein